MSLEAKNLPRFRSMRNAKRPRQAGNQASSWCRPIQTTAAAVKSLCIIGHAEVAYFNSQIFRKDATRHRNHKWAVAVSNNDFIGRRDSSGS